MMGAQLLNLGQNLCAQNLLVSILNLNLWERKCAPFRLRAPVLKKSLYFTLYCYIINLCHVFYLPAAHYC